MLLSSRKTLVVVVSLFFVLFFLAIASHFTYYTWDGSFSRAEFRLTFLASDGKPLEGVEMAVQNERGEQSFFYPVTNNTPTNKLRTGLDGVLIFNHVESYFPEFGGKCGRFLFLFPTGQCSAPLFYCKFIYKGKEVYRIRYTRLNQELWENGLRPIARKWKWPNDLPHHIRPDFLPRDEEQLEFPVYEKTIVIP
jgi:hypothetical protein